MTEPKQTAVIVQRVDPKETPDTDEIKSLAHSAGYEAATMITQSRKEDSDYHVGSGKVADLHHHVSQNKAGTVIFDNILDPQQKYNLGLYLPTDVEVLDRYKLILDIFEQRATTRKAQLQVELARLRYELPRADTKQHLATKDERPGFMGLGEYDETRKNDIKQRIRRIKNELDSIEHTNQRRREQRRKAGFDLVALAGYTNAGKSTLLQRLADDLTVGENDAQHDDIDPTAEATNSLFTTLDTTTRRMDYQKRDVLITDTVGFISDIPNWLVDSFESTLDSVYRADLVLLVADVSEPIDEIREKLMSCHDTLRKRNKAPVVTVLNKVDAVGEEELERKERALKAIAPNPIRASALEGNRVEPLKQRINSELPPLKHERLQLPMTNNTMSLVSHIHDNTYVRDTEYYNDAIVLDFKAPEAVVSKIRHKVTTLTE